MSDFWEVLEEYLGDADAITDVRTVVRRCCFFDFDGNPFWTWQGKGTLITEDGVEWIGSIDQSDTDRVRMPPLQDGRDGSAPSYTISMNIPDADMYEELKAEQWRVSGREIEIYLAIFQEGEALRPTTPITFLKSLTMLSPRFSEKLEMGGSGELVKRYVATIMAKDANFGRSSVPNGTYTDTIQKFRAAQMGVTTDRGCEYVASLANRTLTIP